MIKQATLTKGWITTSRFFELLHLSIKQTLLLGILLFGFANAIAQVTIGSSSNPNLGALLDLKVEDKTDGSANSTKGMGLPRVFLTDKNNLYPMFAGAVSNTPNSDYNTPAKKGTEDLNHVGLVVYNINHKPKIDLCAGLYVWQGNEWSKIGELCEKPSLILDKATDRVLTTGTTKLTATYAPANAVVVWGSLDPTIARVNSNGLVTALQQGNATITASMTVDGDIYTAICPIEVRDLRVAISETNIRLVTGTTMTPTITTSPDWANINTTVWSRVNGTSAAINATSGLITPAAAIPTLEGETSRIRVEVSSGTISAINETNVLAATLRLNTKKTTKNLISRTQDKNNVNVNSQFEVSAYSPTWAATLGSVAISNWISSNPNAATITPNGVMTATTNFPGNGTKTNTRTTTVSAGKVTLVASATYGGAAIATPAASSCTVTVYSVNPYQFTDSRASDTAQTYWTSYFGKVSVNAATDAVEWDVTGNWWMTENLRAIKFPNGTAIPAAPATDYYPTVTPIFTYPEFSASNRATKGVLYNFPAAYGRAMSSDLEIPTDVNVQGVCPNGWHLPNDAEWKQLGTAIQSNASVYSSFTSVTSSNLGNAFKAMGTGIDPNFGASNISSEGGFSALLVGYAGKGGTYLKPGEYTSYWTSTSSLTSDGRTGISYHRNLSSNLSNYNWNGGGRQFAHSVRCMKN